MNNNEECVQEFTVQSMHRRRKWNKIGRRRKKVREDSSSNLCVPTMEKIKLNESNQSVVQSNDAMQRNATENVREFTEYKKNQP